VTEPLQLKSRHFKWVTSLLAHALHQRRVEGSRALLETLEAQQRIGFRDILIEDKSWVYLDTSPISIWIGAEKKPPRDRGQRSTQQKQSSLCLGHRRRDAPGLATSRHVFQWGYFSEHIFQPMATELDGEEKAKHRPLTLVEMDNVKSYTSKRNLSEWKNDISNGPPSVFRPDLAPADFFLFE
jgi:hypothetical protein